MKRQGWLALAGIFAIGSLFVWSLLDSGPRLSLSNAHLETLRLAAVDACMCRRAGNSEHLCDAAYKSERGALLERNYGSSEAADISVAAIACAPVSTEKECFQFTDGEGCVLTRLRVVDASAEMPIREVCTVEEARAIEQAFYTAQPQNGGVATADGGSAEVAAVNDMLRRIVAGEDLPPPTSAGTGCAG